MAATNSPQNIIQNVALNISANANGIGAASNAVSSLHSSLASATKSTSKFIGAMGKVGAAGGAAVLALSLMVKVAKDFLDNMSESGRAMTNFVNATGRGSKAALMLRDSYQGIIETSSKTMISIDQLASSLSKFASQGFTQLRMAGTQETQKFIGDLQNTLAQGMGDPKAAEDYLQRIMKAMGEDTVALQNFQKQWLAAGNNMQAKAEVLAGLHWIDASLAEEGLGAMKTAIETAQGAADGGVATFVTWQNVMSQFDTAISGVKQAFLEAFGPSMSTMIQSAGEWIQKVIFYIRDLGRDFSILGAAAGAIFHNIGEAAASGWNFMKAGFLASIAIMTVSLGKFLDFWGVDVGATMIKFAAETAEAASEAFGKALNPDFVSVEEAMVKEADKWRETQKQIVQQTDKTEAAMNPLKKSLLDIRREAAVILQTVDTWGKSLSNSLGAVKAFAEITQMVGTNFKINNKEVSEFTEVAIQNSIAATKILMEESAKGIAKQDEAISNLKSQMVEASMEGKDTLILQKEIAAEEEKRAKFANQYLAAVKGVGQIIEDNLAGLKTNLDYLGMQKDLAQANLSISKALYGTPALGVKAIQQVVSIMKQEQTNLEQQLKSHMNLMEQMGAGTDEWLIAQKKALDLETKITKSKAEQLSMLKELRDGYLDAVQASAIGAGKFEKILITQEKNLGIALDKRIAKQNYLLGQTGAAARRSNKAPISFSASGIGTMSSGGADLTDDQLQEYNRQAVENVGNDQARSIMAANTDLVNSMHSKVQPMHNASLNATNENTKAVQQNSEVISNYINKGLKGASALGIKGGVNESVVVGAAVNAKVSGASSPTLGTVGVIPTSGGSVASSVGAKPSTPTKSSKSTGGGSWTQKANRIASSLEDAARDIKDFGPVLDELDSEDSGTTHGHPGGRGNFIAP